VLAVLSETIPPAPLSDRVFVNLNLQNEHSTLKNELNLLHFLHYFFSFVVVLKRLLRTFDLCFHPS